MKDNLEQSEIVVAANQKIKERDYWLNKLSGYQEKNYFPTDYDINLKGSEQKKAKFSCRFPTDLFSKLSSVSNNSDLKLHVLLSAGFVLLLHKYTGNEDIVIGTPMYKQTQGHEVDFINTVLILRCFTRGHMSFRELLRQMKDTIAGAVENRNYPVEILAQQLNESYSPGEYFPLFDAAILLQNIQEKTYLQPVKHNMTFSFLRTGEYIETEVEYNALLYHENTIKRIVGHFKQLLEQVLANLELKLSQIEILSNDEKKQILVDFNNTAAQYPLDKTIHGLFEEQIERMVDSIALISKNQESGNKMLSYGELHKKANQWAALLKEKGVAPDTCVAIMMEHSLEMIIGVLGILKSGSAYLPINPNYPEERIDYILKDSRVRFLINKSEIRNPKFETNPNNQNLNDPNENRLFGAVPVLNFENLNFALCASDLNSSNLAYIIYTSGSTGKPKGVMIEHRAAVNILFSLFETYPFSQSDTYLFKTSFEFDVSVSEIFGWFLGGGRLAILESGAAGDPQKIMEAVKIFAVTHINFVPSMFAVFVDQLTTGNTGHLSSLKYIFLAGEIILPATVKKFKKLNNSISLENLYGPTEGTVYASQFSLKEWGEAKSIPIGKPCRNIMLYVLNKYGYLNPVG
ncbi:MAG TPA: AMP-binding protein, partial [Candidatus Kapabacteria bacterium]|nr:AMP-binding protein [Candidatus Kapabacteria bacterium]